jgi:hypothetical protein
MWAVTVPAGPADSASFGSRADAALEAYKKVRTTPIAPPHGGWNNPSTGSGPEPEPEGWTPEEDQQAKAAIAAATALSGAAPAGKGVLAKLQGDAKDRPREDYEHPSVSVTLQFVPLS